MFGILRNQSHILHLIIIVQGLPCLMHAPLRLHAENEIYALTLLKIWHAACRIARCMEKPSGYEIGFPVCQISFAYWWNYIHLPNSCFWRGHFQMDLLVSVLVHKLTTRSTQSLHRQSSTRSSRSWASTRAHAPVKVKWSVTKCLFENSKLHNWEKKLHQNIK